MKVETKTPDETRVFLLHKDYGSGGIGGIVGVSCVSGMTSPGIAVTTHFRTFFPLTITMLHFTDGAGVAAKAAKGSIVKPATAIAIAFFMRS